MKFKILFFLSVSFLFFFTSCSEKIEVGFSFSPEMPKCGQKVTFTNTTTGKDEEWAAKYWNWDFGDGTKSITKSPTHIYTEAGKYTISLRVDSNDNYIKTLDITVYDSIPTIYADTKTDTVNYYTETNFSMLIYNPNSLDVTYDWTFSDNANGADLTNGKSTAADVDVYFSKKNVWETVKVRIILEDELDTVITQKFFVQDIPAKSLLMAQKDGNILRQRIFPKGTEDFSATLINAGKHAFNIFARNNLLYMFDAGTKTGFQSDWQTDTSGDGSIKMIDMSNNKITEVINNNGLSSHFGFFNGSIDTENIYWTDYSEFVYKTPLNSVLNKFTWKGNADAQTTVPYYLVKSDRLGYFGNGLNYNQQSGGICYYDQAYFWAKGGTGRGILRFLAGDILSANSTGTAPVPTLGAILTDFAIRAFTIDRINQKIYFSSTAPSDKVGFWSANLNGTNPKRIDDAPVDREDLYITGIVIDNASNTVYWAYRSPETLGASAPSGTWESYYSTHPTHKTGVKQATLANSFKPAGEVKYFAPGVAAYGLALDEVEK